jgi:hypothetical protein
MAIGNLVIGATEGHAPRATLSEWLLAWGRDISSGEPRYILELTDKQRGSKCGCECASCGQPLTAVNAAKSDFEMRPHFRHPKGAARNECLILSARAAILRHLREDGWLDLPRRRMSSRAVGVSGTQYEAWVDAPRERVRILDIDFRDRAFAVLTLGDGRQLRVQLTGTAGDVTPELNEAGLPVPTIFLATDDLSVAAMKPDEIRRRLTLLPDGIRWCGHWDDEALRASADAAAKAEATRYMDDIPAGLILPDGMDPALKWQTVLHYEVKNILAEACELMAPSMEEVIEVRALDGRILRERVFEPAEMLELTHVDLEQRFGRVVPDLVCQGWASGGIWLIPLFIEVTVTNHIDEERLARIQSEQAYALEIDLSLTGGRVTRDELRRLVVEDVAMKRWLHFPNFESRIAEVSAALQRQLDEELAELEAISMRADARRRLVLTMPLHEIAKEYLLNVGHLLNLERDEGVLAPVVDAAELEARERLADSADKLALRGFPEAADSDLIAWHGILSRVLSIQADCGTAYGYGRGYETGHAVLNAIKQSRGAERSNFSIYFIAARVYKPRFTDAQQSAFNNWADAVKKSIRRGENTYVRDPAYDPLLSLLFPEMAEALAMDFGKRRLAPIGEQRQNRTPLDTPRRSTAIYLEKQPRTVAMGTRLVDTPPGDFWLKGRDLEAWRRANPEAARWFGDPPH